MNYQAQVLIRSLASLIAAVAIVSISFFSSYEPNCDFGSTVGTGGPSTADVIVGCPIVVPVRWAGDHLKEAAVSMTPYMEKGGQTQG